METTKAYFVKIVENTKLFEMEKLCFFTKIGKICCCRVRVRKIQRNGLLSTVKKL